MSRCHGACCARHAQEAREGRLRSAGLTRAERASWWGILLVLLFLTAITFGACPGHASAEHRVAPPSKPTSVGLPAPVGGYGGAKVYAVGYQPKVTLLLRPSVAFLPETEPLKVVATVLLIDPKLKMKCPGVVIFWGDGEKSSIIPDRCLVEDIVERRTWTMTHPYKRSIEGRVEAALLDLATEGAQVIRVTTRLKIFAQVEMGPGSRVGG